MKEGESLVSDGCAQAPERFSHWGLENQGLGSVPSSSPVCSPGGWPVTFFSTGTVRSSLMAPESLQNTVSTGHLLTSYL